jgi:hypothetical protein
MQMCHMINVLSQHAGLIVVSRIRVIKVLTRTLRQQHHFSFVELTITYQLPFINFGESSFVIDLYNM